MNLTSGSVSLPLEDWQISRPLMLFGLGAGEAEARARRIQQLDLTCGPDALTDLVCRSLMEDGLAEVADGVRGLLAFRNAVAGGAVDRPCVIVVGGASGVGKDSLAADLAYLIGIDRSVSTDSARDSVRRQLLQEYGAVGSMPAEKRVLFSPTYRAEDPGALLSQQVGLLSAEVEREVSYYESVEFPKYRHPFVLVQGVHAVPGLLAPMRNRLQLVLTIDEELLVKRYRFRAEFEQGAETAENEGLRRGDARGACAIQRHLTRLAERSGTRIVNGDSRAEMLGATAGHLGAHLGRMAGSETGR